MRSLSIYLVYSVTSFKKFCGEKGILKTHLVFKTCLQVKNRRGGKKERKRITACHVISEGFWCLLLYRESSRDDTEIRREQRNKKSSKPCPALHNSPAIETKNSSSQCSESGAFSVAGVTRKSLPWLCLWNGPVSNGHRHSRFSSPVAFRGLPWHSCHRPALKRVPVWDHACCRVPGGWYTALYLLQAE